MLIVVVVLLLVLPTAWGFAPLRVGGAFRKSASATPWLRSSSPAGSGVEEPEPLMRIGHGFDIHRLIEGTPLVIGGVTIPFKYGADAHSDGDAMYHSIVDSILGAYLLRHQERIPQSDELV